MTTIATTKLLLEADCERGSDPEGEVEEAKLKAGCRQRGSGFFWGPRLFRVQELGYLGFRV